MGPVSIITGSLAGEREGVEAGAGREAEPLGRLLAHDEHAPRRRR